MFFSSVSSFYLQRVLFSFHVLRVNTNTFSFPSSFSPHFPLYLQCPPFLPHIRSQHKHLLLLFFPSLRTFLSAINVENFYAFFEAAQAPFPFIPSLRTIFFILNALLALSLAYTDLMPLSPSFAPCLFLYSSDYCFAFTAFIPLYLFLTSLALSPQPQLLVLRRPHLYWLTFPFSYAFCSSSLYLLFFFLISPHFHSIPISHRNIISISASCPSLLQYILT